MKLISAIIRPNQLNIVCESLERIGIHGMTVTHVKGKGNQKKPVEVYRSKENEVQFVSRTKVEIFVEDMHIHKVISAIREAASTGIIGDGKIFVSKVSQVIRIRTGEADRDAL